MGRFWFMFKFEFLTSSWTWNSFVLDERFLANNFDLLSSKPSIKDILRLTVFLLNVFVAFKFFYFVDELPNWVVREKKWPFTLSIVLDHPIIVKSKERTFLNIFNVISLKHNMHPWVSDYPKKWLWNSCRERHPLLRKIHIKLGVSIDSDFKKQKHFLSKTPIYSCARVQVIETICFVPKNHNTSFSKSYIWYWRDGEKDRVGKVESDTILMQLGHRRCRNQWLKIRFECGNCSTHYR